MDIYLHHAPEWHGLSSFYLQRRRTRVTARTITISIIMWCSLVPGLGAACPPSFISAATSFNIGIL